MHCPHCKHELTPQHEGSVAYWACEACHLLWFDNKEDDFATLEEAEAIYKNYPNAVFKKTGYHCPHCHKAMALENNEYRCYFCGGLLTTGKHLFSAKQKKLLKMEKKTPFQLPHLRTVVILSAVLFLIGINFGIFSNLKQKTTISSQAAEINKFIRIQEVNKNQIAVFFTTDEPSITQAVLTVKKKGAKNETSIIDISTEPSLTHFLLLPKPIEKTILGVRFISPQNKTEITNSKEIVLNEFND